MSLSPLSIIIPLVPFISHWCHHLMSHTKLDLVTHRAFLLTSPCSLIWPFPQYLPSLWASFIGKWSVQSHRRQSRAVTFRRPGHFGLLLCRQGHLEFSILSLNLCFISEVCWEWGMYEGVWKDERSLKARLCPGPPTLSHLAHGVGQGNGGKIKAWGKGGRGCTIAYIHSTTAFSTET